MLDVLRNLNTVLALVAVIAVGFRFGELVGDSSRRGPRAAHRRAIILVLGGYVLGTGIAAAYASAAGRPPNPLTPIFTALHVTVIILCLFWWPHPAREENQGSDQSSSLNK